MMGTSRKVQIGERVMDSSYARFIKSDTYSHIHSSDEDEKEDAIDPECPAYSQIHSTDEDENEDEDAVDPECAMFLKHLREDAKSYVLEMAMNGMACMHVKYEDDNDLEDALKHKCSKRPKDVSSKDKEELERDWENVRRVEKKDIPTALGSACTKQRKIPMVEKGMEENSRRGVRLSQKNKKYDHGVSYKPETKPDMGSDMVNESYDVFLKSLKRVGETFIFMYGDNKYIYEEDDDCSSDSDPVTKRTCNASSRDNRTPPPLISKTVLFKGGSSGTSSKFREKLMNILRKPFDKEEYDELLLKATRKTKRNKKSYLELNTGLCLFQNSSQKGAFAPWLDKACLKLKGSCAKDGPSKDRVELERDWENITLVEKKDIAIASRSASVVNKDMKEKCRKTGRLSQKHDSGGRYKPESKHVVCEEDDDCSLDSDSAIELAQATRKSKTVLCKDSSRGISSKFREKLMDILRKPFDKEEYDKLLLEVNLQKPIQGHKRLHSVEKSYPTKESYLELYTDLAEKIYFVRKNRPGVLNMLRGFFYWLQNSSQKGAFIPWLDEACLKLTGAFTKDVPSKDKFDLEQDWGNITRVEKKDIPIASRTASTKQRKIPVVNKDMEEKCRKTGRLSQKHDPGVLHKPESKHVVGEEDIDCSPDSDSVIELTCAPQIFKTVLGKGSFSGTSSKYREKLMEILGQPFDKEEYGKLLLEINSKKPILGHKRLRSVEKSYPTKINNKSYLDIYPDLSWKIYSVRNNRTSVLNLLRGFFYWLQNLAKEGAFVPWLDEACLRLAGVTGKHATKVENVH